MTAVDHESPAVLAHGAWTPDPRNRLVVRWRDTTPPPAHWHVACEFCGAEVGVGCVYPNGRPASHPHARRVEAYRLAATHSPTSGGTA